MTEVEFNALHPWHQVNWRRCEECGEFFDLRDLSDVLFHRDHVHRPDVQSGKGVNLARVLACAAWLLGRIDRAVYRADRADEARWQRTLAQWGATLHQRDSEAVAAFLRDVILLTRENNRQGGDALALIHDV